MKLSKKLDLGITPSRLIYYVVRGLQRTVLIAAGVSFGCMYAVYFFSVADSTGFDTAMFPIIDGLSVLTVVLSILSLAISFAMLAFPRVKRFQKSLVFDGMLMSLVFIVLTAYVESVFTWIVINLITW